MIWTGSPMLTCDRNPQQHTAAPGRVCAAMAVVPMARMGGFTYIAIMIAVAIIGATLASAGVVWHTVQQRDRERELLFIGDQFRQAIGDYYNSGPGIKQYPARLQDLVRDPRQPGVVRHLRKIYYDPITGTTNWGLIKTTGDRIIGVYSLSDATPIKQANFEWQDREFEGKSKYSEWAFVYKPSSGYVMPKSQPPSAPTAVPQGKQWSSTNY